MKAILKLQGGPYVVFAIEAVHHHHYHHHIVMVMIMIIIIIKAA